MTYGRLAIEEARKEGRFRGYLPQGAEVLRMAHGGSDDPIALEAVSNDDLNSPMLGCMFAAETVWGDKALKLLFIGESTINGVTS